MSLLPKPKWFPKIWPDEHKFSSVSFQRLHCLWLNVFGWNPLMKLSSLSVSLYIAFSLYAAVHTHPLWCSTNVQIHTNRFSHSHVSAILVLRRFLHHRPTSPALCHCPPLCIFRSLMWKRNTRSNRRPSKKKKLEVHPCSLLILLLCLMAVFHFSHLYIIINSSPTQNACIHCNALLISERITYIAFRFALLTVLHFLMSSPIPQCLLFGVILGRLSPA